MPQGFLPRIESMRGIAALTVVGFHVSNPFSADPAFGWLDGFAFSDTHRSLKRFWRCRYLFCLERLCSCALSRCQFRPNQVLSSLTLGLVDGGDRVWVIA